VRADDVQVTKTGNFAKIHIPKLTIRDEYPHKNKTLHFE